MPETPATATVSRSSAPGRRRYRSDSALRRASESGRDTAKIYCTSFDSKIGRIYVASTEFGVCKISVPRESRKDFFAWLKNHFDLDSINDNRSRNKEVIDQLGRYFNGKLAKFTCPIDLVGTTAQIRIWKELSRIPYGVTTTYKQLAKRASVPWAYRAVGRVVGQNPLPIIIPCHRILGSNGSLGGYSCGIKTKEFLLRLEGAIIV